MIYNVPVTDFLFWFFVGSLGFFLLGFIIFVLTRVIMRAILIEVFNFLDNITIKKHGKEDEL